MREAHHGDKVRVDLTRQQAQSFLERMADDDGFRSRLESDPGSTLQDEFGIIVPQDALAASPQLPSKEDARHALEQSGGHDGPHHPAKDVLRMISVIHAP